MSEEIKNEIQEEIVQEESLKEEVIQESLENTSKLDEVLKITKKVFGWIGTGLLAILIVVASWLSIDKYIIKSEIPSIFGYSSLIVATGSMSGTLEEGDLIIIKDTGDYKIGDIVTFFQKDDTIPTTHRIYYIDADGKWVTRGDANNAYDENHITDEDIYGELVMTIPGVGIFIDWLGEGGGYIYVVGFFLIIGIAVYLLKSDGTNVEEITESEEKTEE